MTSPHSISYHQNKQNRNSNKISTSSGVSKRSIFQIYNNKGILNPIFFNAFVLSLKDQKAHEQKLKLEGDRVK